MAIKQFVLLADSKIETKAKAGVTVYAFRKCDYGLASDDSRLSGVEHISVTFNEDGDYPSFTHPKHLLQEVE